MNVIISQQAAENERSSRLSGIQSIDTLAGLMLWSLQMRVLLPTNPG
jgi:hypothetical protein